VPLLSSAAGCAALLDAAPAAASASAVAFEMESYDEFIKRTNIPGLAYTTGTTHNAAAASKAASSMSGSSECSDSSSDSGSNSSSDECSGTGGENEGSDSDSSSKSAPSQILEAGSKAADVDLEFADFDDLKRYAEKLLGCKLSNNKRTTASPPKWLKVKYPEVSLHWTSGTLYCMRQKQEHESYVPWAKTSCNCHLRYVLQPSDRWRIGKHCSQHNHEVVQDVCSVGVSGIRHITNASHLEQDQIRTINAWFDSKTGENGTKFICIHLTRDRDESNSLSF
jgi:hypothetical protein